jgi:excisionase family DNA binding protein
MSKSTRYFTTHDVAKMLGVSAPTVIKWIKQERLQAHTTPGGHRRVSAAALEEFALAYDYPLPSAPEGVEAEPLSMRILVVDGEPDFSEMIAEFLQIHLQCEVVAGGEALQVGYMAGQLVPDVVIYDVDCISIDIQRLMSMIRLTNPQCRLFMTTSLWSDTVEALRAELDPEEVIQKPFKLDILVSHISRK